jgi:hypothetical protein
MIPEGLNGENAALWLRQTEVAATYLSFAKVHEDAEGRLQTAMLAGAAICDFRIQRVGSKEDR